MILGIIIGVIIAVFLVVVAITGIKIVRPFQRGLIERLGKFVCASIVAAGSKALML